MELKVSGTRLSSGLSSLPGTPKQGPDSGKAGKFPVFELSEEAPPKTLHEAAEKGMTNMVVKMIERTIDFDINQRDRMLRTALHWAAESGQHETAQTLIDFGIDVKAVDCTGRTSLHLAARCGDAEMLRIVLEGVADKKDKLDLVNAADSSSITPVFLALQRGDEGQAAFEFLMANGARYNQQVVDGEAAA